MAHTWKPLEFAYFKYKLYDYKVFVLCKDVDEGNVKESELLSSTEICKFNFKTTTEHK